MKKNKEMEKYEESVEELRRRVKGLLNEEMFHDDNLFERFLVARNLDIDAAETMLRNHIRWREINRMDTFLKDYTPPEVSKYIAFNHFGFDKDGAPVIYVDCGQADTKGIFKATKSSDVMKIVLRLLELVLLDMKERSEKTGTKVYQWRFIANFEHLSLALATDRHHLEFWMHLAQTYDANYPERMKSFCIINAQFYFMLGFAVVKPWIPPATLTKIHVFGKDGWRAELLKQVDENEVPAFLGGTRTDPDGNPLCNTFINHGKKVPESMYIKKPNFLDEYPNADTLVVGRRSKVTVEHEVQEAGSDLVYQFDLKSKDIGFRVLYKESKISVVLPDEIIPWQKIETSKGAEEGLLKCHKAGIYILEFDNSSSWIFSKELYYIISVQKT